MATVVGAWVNTASSYTTNYLGYGNGLGLGYFNGYIDDFRVYTRAISNADVFSLWNYGLQMMGTTANTQYANLIDPSAIQIYYSFDQGTGTTNVLPTLSVLPTYGTIGIGLINLTYGTANTYYYVSVARNKLTGGGIVVGTPQIQPVASTTFTDSSLVGITADSSYTYTVVPYGQAGNNGTAYTTAATSPRAACSR